MKKLDWKKTDTQKSAGPEVLTIWRAENYLIGEIGGCFNLYRDAMRLGVFTSMRKAKEIAELDRRWHGPEWELEVKNENGVILEIRRAGEYLIGSIGECHNLYRDETKLGLFHDLRDALEAAEADMKKEEE